MNDGIGLKQLRSTTGNWTASTMLLSKLDELSTCANWRKSAKQHQLLLSELDECYRGMEWNCTNEHKMLQGTERPGRTVQMNTNWVPETCFNYVIEQTWRAEHFARTGWKAQNSVNCYWENWTNNANEHKLCSWVNWANNAKNELDKQ